MKFSYLLAAFPAAYALVFLLLRLRTWRKQKRSADWPLVDGVVESSEIEPYQTGGHTDATRFRLTVAFSYQTEGFEHSGKYTNDFTAWRDAENLLRSLENGPFYVRYNPDSPSDHFVDPYRDVWQPGRQTATGSSPSKKHTKLPRLNRWTQPVLLGQLIAFQIVAGLVVPQLPVVAPVLFWFIAAAYSAHAITTRGCYFWSPKGERLPTWIGRTATLLVALGWMVAGLYRRNH